MARTHLSYQLMWSLGKMVALLIFEGWSLIVSGCKRSYMDFQWIEDGGCVTGLIDVFCLFEKVKKRF